MAQAARHRQAPLQHHNGPAIDRREAKSRPAGAVHITVAVYITNVTLPSPSSPSSPSVHLARVSAGRKAAHRYIDRAPPEAAWPPSPHRRPASSLLSAAAREDQRPDQRIPLRDTACTCG